MCVLASGPRRLYDEVTGMGETNIHPQARRLDELITRRAYETSAPSAPLPTRRLRGTDCFRLLQSRLSDQCLCFLVLIARHDGTAGMVLGDTAPSSCPRPHGRNQLRRRGSRRRACKSAPHARRHVPRCRLRARSIRFGVIDIVYNPARTLASRRRGIPSAAADRGRRLPAVDFAPAVTPRERNSGVTEPPVTLRRTSR